MIEYRDLVVGLQVAGERAVAGVHERIGATLAQLVVLSSHIGLHFVLHGVADRETFLASKCAKGPENVTGPRGISGE